MALIGFMFQGAEELLEHKDKELKAEIFATQFARSMLEQGTHPMTILEAVHKMLKWTDHEPVAFLETTNGAFISSELCA